VTQAINVQTFLTYLVFKKKKEMDSDHSQEGIGHDHNSAGQTVGRGVEEGQESIGRGMGTSSLSHETGPDRGGMCRM
jgi:hypothetical protein